MYKIVILVSIMMVLFGCKTYSDDDKKSFDQEIKAYLEKNNIKCERSESGLYYKIIEPGEGNFIRFQDIVSFSYKGTFLNGDVFDQQTKSVEFKVKNLIGAWKEIMLELKPGAKAFLVVPPQLGYGNNKLDDIPANSILVFEMEIHEVK